MKKAIKYIIGVAALPLAIGFSRGFYAELQEIIFMSERLKFFLWGFVIYMIMHILFYKPFYIYTLGHEAIHVLATWMCGGHVTAFSITPEGGSVTTSKSNFFIELSPYFVPIYTLILIFLMPVVKSTLLDLEMFSMYIFGLGFTLAMHLVMTATVLKMRQPDILKSGYEFSFVLIYIANLVIIFLFLAFLSDGITFKSFVVKSLRYSKEIYLAIVNKFF